LWSSVQQYGSRTRGNNNVKIIFASKDDFIVQGDRGRLSQVLSKFIDNAIKFTQEGNIDISVEKMQNDNVVVLSVRDTGSGIDPDIMPRLFYKIYYNVICRNRSWTLYLKKYCRSPWW
jgi:signal transduction histidine kinase